MIHKAEMKRIQWVLTGTGDRETLQSPVRGSELVPLYESLKRDAVLLYDEVVELQKDLEIMRGADRDNVSLAKDLAKAYAVLKTIRSGINERFTDRAGWGRMIDEVLKP